MKFASNSYHNFSVQIDPYTCEITVKEWLPNAHQVFVAGDFNDWNDQEFPMERKDYGWWVIKLPGKESDNRGVVPLIEHNSKYKLFIKLENGESFYRNPAWSKFLYQDENDKSYTTVFWNPPEKYEFQHPRPHLTSGLRIYECHVGMSSPDEKVNTYIDFADNVLPKILY